MKTLFVVGGITPDMQTALTPHFTLIHKDNLPDPAAWLNDNGGQIDYVITNGHDGLPTDLMVKMPNLALISNYGVGYDAIDTTAAQSAGRYGHPHPRRAECRGRNHCRHADAGVL